MRKRKSKEHPFSGFYPTCLLIYRLLQMLPVWKDSTIEKHIGSLQIMSKNQLQEQVILFRCKQIATMLVILMGAIGLWMMLTAKDMLQWKQNGSGITIMRNTYGQLASEEQLLVTVNGNETTEVKLEVQPRQYTKKELGVKIQEAMDYVEEHLKGENDSLDRVWKSLYLPTELPDNPIEVRWTSDAYDLIHTDGTVCSDNLKAPAVVCLTAKFSYEEEEKKVTYPVCVVSPEKTAKEKTIAKITGEIQQQEKNSREKQEFTIPNHIGNALISKKDDSKNNNGIIIIIGLIIGALLFTKQQEELKQQVKERESKLRLGYPELVRQLSLLIGSGITMKGAFQKLENKYLKLRDSGGEIQPVYEEIIIANRQMEQGISQMEALEQWGKRIGLTMYRKLANLLMQNASMGNAGLVSLLEQEELTAMEQRRQLAKKMGEEASTKLLFPMIMLLAVTIMLILLPALIRFQM